MVPDVILEVNNSDLKPTDYSGKKTLIMVKPKPSPHSYNKYSF